MHDVRNGANLRLVNMASQNGFVETVHLLLAAGADLRHSCPQGHTALIMAKSKDRTAIVALLEARLAELATHA